MDLGFVQSKLRLGDRVVFKIERIVIQRYRLGNQLQAPGLDVLEICAPRTHATVISQDVYAVHRICIPPEVQVSTMPLVPRPATLPGSQRYRLAEPNPPDCTVKPTDPAPKRCWPARGVYVDVATPGADHASYGTVYPTEYDVHMVNMTYLCERVMTAECIQSLGYLGCAYNALSHMDPPWQLAAGAAAAPGGAGARNGSSSGSSSGTAISRFPISGGLVGGTAAAGATGSSAVGGSGSGSQGGSGAGTGDQAAFGGGGGDGDGANVGAIVGGVLGGVAVAVLISAAVVLVWRRRQPPAAAAAKAAATCAKQHYGGGGGGSHGKTACPSCGRAITLQQQQQQQQQQLSLSDTGREARADSSTSGNVVSSWCGRLQAAPAAAAAAAAAANHSDQLLDSCPHCGAAVIATAVRATADGGGGGGGGRELSSKLAQGGGSSSGVANVCVELQAQSTSTITPVVQSLEVRVESMMHDFAVAVGGGTGPEAGGGGAPAAALAASGAASGAGGGVGAGAGAAVAPSEAAAAAGMPLAALLAAAISTGVSVSSAAGVAGVGGAASASQAHSAFVRCSSNATDGAAGAAAAATPAPWSALVPSVSSAGAAPSAPSSRNVDRVFSGGAHGSGGAVAVASVAAAEGLGRVAAAGGGGGGGGVVSGRQESAAWLVGNTGGVSETALAATRATGGGDGGEPVSPSHYKYYKSMTDDLDVLASHIDMVVTPFTPARPDVNLSAVLLPYASPAASAAPLPSLPAATAAQAPAAAGPRADPAAVVVGASAPEASAAAAAGAATAAAAGAAPSPACSLSFGIAKSAAAPAAAATDTGASPAAAAAAAAVDAGAAVAYSAGSGVASGSPAVTPCGSIEGALFDSHVRLTSVVRGRGSFGKVVEGTYCGERVAVKLMRRTVDVEDCCAAAGEGGGGGGGGGGAASRVVTAFRQEVEVLARLQHPNVVRLLAACMTPPRFCLVMELMETSLEGLLKAAPGRLLPLNAVMGIALDVARGLQYLHPTIVHRDLKPANVLVGDPLGPRQVAKLSDFGLARLRSSVVVTRNPEAGTPPYMAPECFDATATSLTHHVDAYSFGVLLWAMLSGREPWAGLNCVSLAYRVAYGGERPPLDAIPPERRPPKLTRLIAQCWEADPKRRPAAAEVVKELLLVRQMFMRGMAVSDMADPPADGSGNYRAAAAAVAAAGAAGQGLSQKRLLQPGLLATMGVAAAAELLGTERLRPEPATAAVAAAGGQAAAGAAAAAPSDPATAAVLAWLRVPVPLGRGGGGGGSKPPAAAAALTPEQVEEEAARMCADASLYRYGDEDGDDYLGYGRAWQLGSSWLAESPSATATASAANGGISTAATTTAAGASVAELAASMQPQPQPQQRPQP
ncbi:hypothetical protein HYH02_013055 [Chlamydomonas schloesseri]|uniref:Protein kinase domain-containing protein n=1 Tax=Chlamydomonas schloesseri TaxID=2026947 RepID=A0A835T678_9CHLO|nr:hypothetical protein HYH02_013055 [Chlamydomonas schloesseri]|eukprot:KAG2432336.1 hypothetical protein HYH02_013055 [Chlamydomonas schloesseri]